MNKHTNHGTNHDMNHGTQDKRKVNPKLILFLLLLIFLGPLGFAFNMHNKAKHTHLKQNNVGDLIIPVKQAHDLYFRSLNNHLPLVFRGDTLKGKWQFLYIPPLHCDENCHDNLHMMGQIHQALHKSATRLERMLVLLENHQMNEFANYDKKYLLEAKAYENTLSSISNKTKRDTVGEFYIIDPQGNIMMYYTGDTPPKGILKDLNKLMKVSKIG